MTEQHKEAEHPRGTNGKWIEKARPEPTGITLEARREYAKPLALPDGARAMIDGEFGTVASSSGDGFTGGVILKLDGGGSISAPRRRVVNWDAWLDLEMPPLDSDHSGSDDPVDPDAADRYYQALLVNVRNCTDSADALGDDYYAGRAAAWAQAAAAMADADSDPQALIVEGAGLLARDREQLDPDRIKSFTAAPLSKMRCRRLAAHFLTQAVKYKSASPTDEADQDMEAVGAANAFVSAAAKFSGGLTNGDRQQQELETRMLTLIDEGRDNINEIAEMAWDEEAWR